MSGLSCTLNSFDYCGKNMIKCLNKNFRFLGPSKKLVSASVVKKGILKRFFVLCKISVKNLRNFLLQPQVHKKFVFHLLVFYKFDMLRFRWDQSIILLKSGCTIFSSSIIYFGILYARKFLFFTRFSARCYPHSNLIFHDDLRLLSSQPFLLDHYPITINWP